MNKLEELRRKRQKAEDKYKSFLENFDGIAFKRFEDLTTDFFTGNVESITGYTEEDFLSGKIRFKQLILPGDIDAYKEEFTEFMSSSRKNSERRFRISDKYGDIHYVRERVRKKFNKETQKKYVYGTIQDITRYAEIKQELEKYQHHLQRLVDKKIKDLKIKNQALDASLNAIAITDMEGNITHINSAFLRLWGYESKDEVIGRSGTEFWGDEAKAITGFKKILRSGDFKGELLAVRENGTKMFLDTKANLIKDENNKPIGIVGTFTDVTKHLKTEQKLKKNKQILQKKLNQILSPDYEVCEEDFGNIVDIEQLQNIMDDFYKLTNIGVAIENIKGDVLVATGWQDICTEFHRVHPETRKKCIESDIYLSENAKPGEYLAYKCKNNMWDIATPIMIGNKKIGNLLLGQFFYDDEEIDYNFFIEQAKKFGFDVGEYIAALERVPRWSRERVKKVMDFYSKFAEMLSDLSYSNLKLAHLLQEKKKIGQKLIKERNNSDFYKELLAHDMGNILNNLKSALALMEMYKTSQDKVKNSEEIMEIFENQVNRGTSLIKNVRRLSEIEKQEQKIKDINVIPIIQKSIEDIPKISQGKEICIQTKIPDQRLMVRGGELLMDAFDNILNNGIKHNNKEQVKLWVEISKIQKNQEKFVRIEFKDNGIGISDQRKKYIFQKDFKKAKRKGGMGIGLSLVRRIIEGYRGEISVHNLVEGESDKGSNFIVLLKKSTSSN